MAVSLVNSRYFEVTGGKQPFIPTATEIYGVVIEGETSLRGVPVTAAEFLNTGIRFPGDAADPLIILEATGTDGAPTISCHLAARLMKTEAEVPQDVDKQIDYAIGGDLWMPLPLGTLEEASQFLASAGMQRFGPMTLAQYMTVLRKPVPGLTIEDRTGEALAAGTIAPHLPGTLPQSFKGSLYNYQSDGYRWLSFMTNGGLGCIIADEMGLGKTVQVICLLIEAVEARRTPNVVIAPATLLENWRRELQRFAPSLNPLVHGGSRRTGYPDQLRAHDVVITSFETAVADISLFRSIQWNLFVLDEAQGIKNPGSKRATQLKTIPRHNAIAVTGTPVENRLKDLWSLTDFVSPSLLGSLPEFERRHPDTLDGARTLEPIVSPLILRRLVAEVATDLPERIDIPQPLELDPDSAGIYEAIRANASAQHSGTATLAALTTLRMFCMHPWIADQLRGVRDPLHCSPKLNRLLEVLEEIADADGKALIFTSYQEGIDLLRDQIATHTGIHTDFIDGRVPVPDRQRRVDDFSASAEPGVLLLNPRAAGTGLNITAANHVIHYNLEWNPAVEDQASARAHRRGQKRPVTVHRFFYINTVEEVIDDRMRRKRELAAAAIVGTDGREQEMADILRALRITPAGTR